MSERRPSPPTRPPLRITFVDPVRWDYDVATPGERPLGGSQSALCYLASALAARGHRVALRNGIAAPRAVGAIDCRPLAAADEEDWRRLDSDAVIVLNLAAAGPRLRPLIGPRARLVLWSQNEPTNPTNAGLDGAARDSFDAVVCVSDWHARAMGEAFALVSARLRVMRNTVAPAFEALLDASPPDAPPPDGPPRLIYTSAPTRGLAHLVERVFPAVLARRPGTRLEVYSSFATYQVAPAEDPCAALYEACRTHPQIDYVGSLPQVELARRLAGSGVLCYPNTHPETSSIAVMEAMASGCAVVAPALAALPETTAGFARLVPIKQASGGFAVEAFVAATLAELEAVERRDPALVERLARQREHVRRSGGWARRAADWSSWLETL